MADRGQFDIVAPAQQMVYTALSWTEGKEADSRIDHTTTVAFQAEGDFTMLHLDIEITKIGPKAKMAAFGMRMGYKQYLKKLDTYVAA